MHCISGVAYSVGTKATRRKAAVYYAAHVFNSRKSEKKILCLESFTFVYQLYCCSSNHNNNKALRITFNGYYVAKP